MAVEIRPPESWVMEVNTVPPFEGLGRMPLQDANPYIVLLREPAHHFTLVHSHPGPETMFVLQGRIMLNGRWCGPGTVITVDGDEEYWHTTGADGCVVALIRPQGRGGFTPGLQVDTTAASPAGA